MKISRRIITILFILGLVFISGIIGYMVIEKWSVMDAFYMTMITLTTVGFMEVHPLSTLGRIFTILLLFFGFSVIIYGLGTVVAFFVEGELLGILRRRKMEKKIAQLSRHYIICGAGDVGQHVIGEFYNVKKPFVVIERDAKEIESLQQRFPNILYIGGDASEDMILIKSGIKDAKGLITTFASDKDNLFVVLTARSLNPALRIVTRCNEDESEHKLLTAGANKVVSAHRIGGMRMASEMLRPIVVSFLDIMLRTKDRILRVEEATVQKGSKFDGLTLEEADIPEKSGLIVVAIKDGQNEDFFYNPRSNYQLKSNDVLIMLGEVQQVEKLHEFTTAP